MRVLVVDHNRDDLDRMDQILENQAGIDYRLCDRPDQALTLLNKGEIDCLLLDIHMPAMDGLQMIQKVRELQGGTWLPTLFMASAEDVKSRGRALRAQGDAMLTKPIEPEILLNQLQVIERLVKAQAELKAAKDRVEQIAREDDLTGILNRRGIEQELHQAIALSWRFNTPMSLLLIDVDRFRAFNEAHGVQAGDQALKMIGQALSNCSKRQSDVLGRFSGEEFVLGLPATDQAGANAVADRVLTAIEHLNIKTDSSPVGRLSVSIGVSTLVPTGGPMEVSAKAAELMDVADQAMFEAKGLGGNARCSAKCGEMET